MAGLALDNHPAMAEAGLSAGYACVFTFHLFIAPQAEANRHLPERAAVTSSNL